MPAPPKRPDPKAVKVTLFESTALTAAVQAKRQADGELAELMEGLRRKYRMPLGTDLLEVRKRAVVVQYPVPVKRKRKAAKKAGRRKKTK